MIKPAGYGVTLLMEPQSVKPESWTPSNSATLLICNRVHLSADACLGRLIAGDRDLLPVSQLAKLERNIDQQ